MPVVGRKSDSEKTRWDLLQFDMLKEVAEVATFGAKKYAPDNWKKVPDPVDRYFSALMRHLVAWRMGEETDEETGFRHLAHACWNVLSLMWFTRRRGKSVKEVIGDVADSIVTVFNGSGRGHRGGV